MEDAWGRLPDADASPEPLYRETGRIPAVSTGTQAAVVDPVAEEMTPEPAPHHAQGPLIGVLLTALLAVGALLAILVWPPNRSVGRPAIATPTSLPTQQLTADPLPAQLPQDAALPALPGEATPTKVVTVWVTPPAPTVTVTQVVTPSPLAAWTLGPGMAGPLRLDMTKAEVAAQGVLVPDGHGGYTDAPAYAGRLHLEFSAQGKLQSINVTDPAAKTAEGAGVGSSADDLAAAYGGKLVPATNKNGLPTGTVGVLSAKDYVAFTLTEGTASAVVIGRN